MHHKDVLKQSFVNWLPLGVSLVVVVGFIHLVVQQNYRHGANDPQIQVAEDVAFAITHGQASYDTIVPAQPNADITQSLSTFLEIFNATGTPVGSSVQLDGKIPMPPSGVFDYAKAHGENRFTWQPKPGLRYAAVVTTFTGPQSGYVVVGRSLREVEVRELQMLIMTLIALAAALVLSFLLVMYNVKYKSGILEALELSPEHHHEHPHS